MTVTVRQPPIVAIARFTLWPNRAQVWLGTWEALARVAQSIPACRRVRILADSTDEIHPAVLSEWDSREAFDLFWRGAGITWIEDALDYSQAPTNIFVFTVMSPDERE